MLALSANTPNTGYNLTRSLRFRASASAYLSRTPASAGNRSVWTWSGWVKRGKLGAQQTIFASYPSGSTYAYITFNSSDQLRYASTSTGGNLITTRVFRDPSAWYHIVISYDDTQATASNRLKFYINGVQETAFGTATYPDQNWNGYINGAFVHNIARFPDGSEYFDGYLAETYFIDGQALTPSSFGSTNSTTGVWQPAKYTGTYGTNGFYLPFTDNSALTTSSNVGLGKDFSGNGNFWTTNNISITSGVTYDSMTDVPTLTSATAANFAVINPLDIGGSGNLALTQANLKVALNSGTDYTARCTIGVTSGKYYWEVTMLSTQESLIGVANSSASLVAYLGSSANGWAYDSVNGSKYNGTSGAYGATWTTNDVIGIALDMDAKTLTYYKNNVSQGVAFTNLAGTIFPAVCVSATGGSLAVNFGQRPFTYTPPSGFVALNAYNLPDSTIKQGNKVMDATLYTGNGSADGPFVYLGFRPKFVLIKKTSAIGGWLLHDTVRSSYNVDQTVLIPNLSDSENVNSAWSIDELSNGFKVRATDGQSNENGGSYIYAAFAESPFKNALAR